MGQLLLLNKMKLNIVTIEGTKVGDLAVEKSVFGIKPNHAVVRQAILSEMSNMRQGTHASKNRAMVNGGGKKPWKQKADNFFKGLNIADMNKGLLLASGALVLISYGLMITCYSLLCITAIYIIEDVNELGTKSRFPDKVYRIAKIELWAGAGMLAMIIASAIHG